MQIQDLYQSQWDFFREGATRNLNFRQQQLELLLKMVDQNQAVILEALQKDLGKNEVEAFLTEIAVTLQELRFALKNLRKWAQPERVPTPLMLAPASSWIESCPRGVTLIIGPWNYPFQLVIAPLIGSLAAGNTAVLKPSEHAPHTAQVIANLCHKTFDPRVVACVNGGIEVSKNLLALEWDYIFFTGGTTVGRIVATAAAEHLTPCTLELGGKSPVVVDGSVDLYKSCRRIAWGRFINAGQTCIAPDYAIVHESIRAHFVETMKQVIKDLYGEDPRKSPDYGRLIHVQHARRLHQLLQSSGLVLCGGDVDLDALYMAPTLVADVDLDSALMKEEIFGPILPILTYNSSADLDQIIAKNPHPLAFYLFSQDPSLQAWMRAQSFGGGCINDTIKHVANHHLPFGGVRQSGIGAYHGRASFDTFSHRRSLLKASFAMDGRWRYPPYSPRLLRWLKSWI